MKLHRKVLVYMGVLVTIHAFGSAIYDKHKLETVNLGELRAESFSTNIQIEDNKEIMVMLADLGISSELPEMESEIQELKRPEQSKDSSLEAYLQANSDKDNMTPDFISLCATIHHEAGPSASLRAKMAVGYVIMNRLRNKADWHYSNLNELIYDEDQFSVIHLPEFEQTKADLRSGNIDDYMVSTILAANLVMTGSELYAIPEDVCYFYGDKNKRTWCNHEYCFTIEGNSFFK